MAKRLVKRRTQADQNMDPYSFSWKDVFYIHNLNDGTLEYRKEDEAEWYNLCLRPNPFYNVGRHLCLACGSRYEGMLNTIKNYVSAYDDPRDMLDSIANISNEWNRRLGKVMMEYAEYWWDTFSRESTEPYDADIEEAIEIGKRTKIYSGPNIKVKYTEDEDECSVEGRWAEWFEEFVDKCMGFNGYTKVEFAKLLENDCDVEGVNQIFGKLKSMGVKGIKQMKRLNMYRWIDVLAPLTNKWEIVDVDDNDEEYVEGEDE